jgi:hypothetical protein
VPCFIMSKSWEFESIAFFQLGSVIATARLAGSSEVVRFAYRTVPSE